MRPPFPHIITFVLFLLSMLYNPCVLSALQPCGYLICGLPREVEIQGTYAYVAAEGIFVIMDISDPLHPVPVSYFEPPGYAAYGVALQGDYAYLACNSGGLCVVDISDPNLPQQAGVTLQPTSAQSVAVDGNFAYVADGENGLRIIDISNPASPGQVGYQYLTGTARAVAVKDSTAFVADGDDGLRIIDVSTPSAPNEIAFHDTPGYAFDIALDGNFAYVADYQEGVAVFDLSSPASPSLTAYAYMGSGVYTLGVDVAGNYLYVAQDLHGLRIVDIANPSQPVLLGAYDTPGLAKAVRVNSSHAYVADYSRGLRVIDIDDKNNPAEAGNYSSPGSPQALEICGHYMYVVDLYTGLHVIDFADPTHPLEVYNYSGFLLGRDIAISGNRLYVATQLDGLLQFSITDPASPHLLASTGSSMQFSLLAVTQNLACAVTPWTTSTDLIFFDIPRLSYRGSYNTPVYPDSPRGLALENDWAYIADYDNLLILNITDPASPVIESTFPPVYDHVYNVDVKDGIAYLLESWGVFRVVDVSNPASPLALGQYATSSVGQTVQVYGDYAYIANMPYNFKIVDVRNKNAPAEIDFCNALGRPTDFRARGLYAGGTSEGAGIYVFDIVSYAPPTPTCTHTPTVTPTVTLSATASPESAAGILLGRKCLACPNPARQEMRFFFQLESPTTVRVLIYNIAGELASSLEAELDAGGNKSLVWNCEQMGPGIYFARIFFGGSEVEKLKVSVVK
ncbi:hypothetical protein JW933_01920 [candidate division FCPU426 bacterium]|nr:hypothetical protein [candidate division FCPU426 bacterium]